MDYPKINRLNKTFKYNNQTDGKLARSAAMAAV
jgi:hypothetical protein